MTAASALLLLGQNLSGRSEWLASRRRERPWPKSAYIGPFPELACTGLASTVAEEINLGGSPSIMRPSRKTDLSSTLELSALVDRRIHTLSGGEAVRVALASTAAQGIDELHVDTALEQLDVEWRPRILRLLTTNHESLAITRIVADNHLSPFEEGCFTRCLHFPLERPSMEIRPCIIDVDAFGAFVRPTSAEPLALERLSFRYSRRTPDILRDINAELEPGHLYILSGPNGSGKTTLVKLLSGTLRARRGCISYGLQQFRPARSRTRFASSAFQNPDYQWTRTSVAAQLAQQSDCSFGSIEAIEKLAMFGIPASLQTKHPSDLPFVFKKRLGVALTLTDNKPWLIFDEPTLGQGESFVASLAQAFRIALQAGRGIILISHDTSFKRLFPEAQELSLADGTMSLSPPAKSSKANP